jgi:hypothetical protein
LLIGLPVLAEKDATGTKEMIDKNKQKREPLCRSLVCKSLILNTGLLRPCLLLKEEQVFKFRCRTLPSLERRKGIQIQV